MKHIVLVGPPGVGKSTLVKYAKEKGYWAVDLEEYETKDTRLAMIPELMKQAQSEEGKVAVYAAADVGRHFPDEQVERVLLLPPKDVYLKRFYERDASNSDKAKQKQKAEIIYDDFETWWRAGVGKYHQVIQTEQDVAETLELILKNLKRKKKLKKIDQCEFDYWMILVYVCSESGPEIALFKCGPYWTTYYNYSPEGFDDIKKQVTAELGIDGSMSYPGRFVNMGHDLTFPWDRSTVVWTSVIRLQNKVQLKPLEKRFEAFEWFSKEEAVQKLKGTKFEYAYHNEFGEDTFWECLDK